MMLWGLFQIHLDGEKEKKLVFPKTSAKSLFDSVRFATGLSGRRFEFNLEVGEN